MAELSAFSGLPLGVTRVLLGDLLKLGQLVVHDDRRVATPLRTSNFWRDFVPGFSSSPDVPYRQMTSAKIVIAGGFGVGKTTSVGAISEIPPIRTESWMTASAEQIDRLDPGNGKTTTTVAMDFGRVTIDDALVLYLFGTPGQPRFWPMWDDLVRGAVGALVLVDTRNLQSVVPGGQLLRARRRGALGGRGQPVRQPADPRRWRTCGTR